MSETMKVKITGVSKETYWYADKIGEVFEVEDERDSDGDFLVMGRGPRKCIEWKDCEVLIENNVQNSNEQQYDSVNKPFHYHDKGLDPLTIMKATFTREQLIGFVKGSALKYLMRYEKKNGVEDIEKLAFYSKLLKELEDEAT